MFRTLAVFWLRRFAVLFAAAFAVLSIFEWIQSDSFALAQVASVAAWSAVSAAFAASVATYWGYKRQCAVVFPSKDGAAR